MDEMQFIGYAISAIITLGGFVAVIQKFTQPINDLRVLIQKLTDQFDMLTTNNVNQDKKLEKHDEQIDKLDHRVGKIETKMEMYHKE